MQLFLRIMLRGLFTVALFGAAVMSAEQSAAVRVWQDVLELPTYVELQPDPNPPFEQFRPDAYFQFYPYSIRDRLNPKRGVTKWRSVVLENKYLRCIVLPDLGGHVYSCVDKISGRSMFYDNRSIKKALVSYRGSWAAFGIEFNFPVSHNYVSVSPVDYSYEVRPDGSGVISVGNTDRVSGMQWVVQLVLKPERAVLEQHVTLVNRDLVRHRYFWWTNAAVEVWDDSRVEYPMRFTEGHDLIDIDTWPVDSKGVDLSIIRNQKAGTVSRFVHGSREPFCGVYHPSNHTGVVHYADYNELPAKKIWSWGLAARGMRFRKALSDDNSAYVEVQGGLMRNQETYAFLEPAQTIKLTEYWLPVRETGGITRANLNAVLSLSRVQPSAAAAGLRAALNVTHSEPNAVIVLLDGTREVSRESVSLSPEQTWSRTWPDLASDRTYTFRLLSSSGETLIEHTENHFDWTPADQVKVGPIAKPTVPPKDKWTADDFLREGTNLELNGKLLKAYEMYESGLQRYPDSVLQKAAGRLAVEMLRYDRAVELLSSAAKHASDDLEIRYYLGVANSVLKKQAEARADFEAVLGSSTLRAAAALRLAELVARNGDLSEAVRYARQATSWSPNDLRSGSSLVTLLRLSGDTAAAKELVREWLLRYPHDNVLRYEQTKLGTGSDALWVALAGDSNHVLDLADYYIGFAAWEDAKAILEYDFPSVALEQSEPGEPSPVRDPLVRYYCGYVRSQAKQDPSDSWRMAAELLPRYVFPNRAQALVVLTAAIEANTRDANAHYLLGELLFSRGMTDAAISHWQQAIEANPKLPEPYYCLGCTLYFVKHSPDEAATMLKQGMKLDPANAGFYVALNEVLLKKQTSDEMRAAILGRFPHDAEMSDIFARLLIDTLRVGGRKDDADRLEREHQFFEKEF